MRLLLTLIPLLLSAILMQLSSGVMGPLDVISGRMLGFSAAEIGYLGSAHFAGFFAGAYLAPKLMGAIGHVRAFTVLAALGALGAIGHSFSDNAYIWAVLRILSGLSIAGSYTVIESWMNARVTNDTRGRVFGAYRVVDMSAAMVAQLMIGFLPAASYVSYNILTVFCLLSLIPITMTRSVAPSIPKAPRLNPAHVFRISPLATVAAIVAGVNTASFRTIGPLYAGEVGLSQAQIGAFLAACIFGGALGQVPFGWLSDRTSRRRVMAILSGLAILGATLCVLAVPYGAGAIIAASFAFGLASFPLYSIAAAHANDFAGDDDWITMAAGMMFFYSCGAVIAPIISAQLIDIFGTGAMFAFISLAHGGLLLYSFIRSKAPPAPDQYSFETIPRTSLTIGALIRGKDRKKKNRTAKDG